MTPELVLLHIPYPSMCLDSKNDVTSSCASPLHYDARRSTFTGVAQWDMNHTLCLATIKMGGILQTYTLNFHNIDNVDHHLCSLATFQLHLRYGGDPSYINKSWTSNQKPYRPTTNNNILPLKAVDVQWGNFEFIPGRPREIIFFQVNSNRILFAYLPKGPPFVIHGNHASEEEVSTQDFANCSSSKVFCIGRHSSSILCISVRFDGLIMVSSALDGSIRIWRLADGAMLCQTSINSSQGGAIENQGLESISNRQPRKFCGVCTKEIQTSWPYANILMFVGQGGEVVMGSGDGVLRLWDMEKPSVDLEHETRISSKLQLIYTEMLLSSTSASISAVAIYSLNSTQVKTGKMGYRWLCYKSTFTYINNIHVIMNNACVSHPL